LYRIYWGVFELIYENRITNAKACFPEGVDNQQEVEIFMKWANDHPEYRHINAGIAVAQSLTEAFPCSKDGAQ
jgi:hypothetical protein